MWNTNEIKSFQNDAREAAKSKLKLEKDLSLRNTLEDQKLRNAGAESINTANIKASEEVEKAKAGYYTSEAAKIGNEATQVGLENTLATKVFDSTVAKANEGNLADAFTSSLDRAKQTRGAMNSRFDVSADENTASVSGKDKLLYSERMKKESGYDPLKPTARPSRRGVSSIRLVR